MELKIELQRVYQGEVVYYGPGGYDGYLSDNTNLYAKKESAKKALSELANRKKKQGFIISKTYINNRIVFP